MPSDAAPVLDVRDLTVRYGSRPAVESFALTIARGEIVGLTGAGLRTAERANAAYAAERQRVLAPLSDAEVEDLDRAVHRLLDVLTDHAERESGVAVG